MSQEAKRRKNQRPRKIRMNLLRMRTQVISLWQYCPGRVR